MRRLWNLPGSAFRYGVRRLTRARFRRQVAATAPIRVRPESAIELHMLCGAKGVAETIAAAKSFLRFKSDVGVVIHEDGSFRSADAETFQYHLPGVRIIGRARADREVTAKLHRLGYPRCTAVRAQYVLMLKFFDLHYYGQGKRVLYFDSDVLFLREPGLLLDALADVDSPDRYNEDVREFYAWPRAELCNHTGLAVLPRLNAGLLLMQRDRLHWEHAEHCLALPVPEGQDWYLEQTLAAVDFTVAGAQPLPLEYDVCFRHAWRNDWHASFDRQDSSNDAVTEHYCGGEHLRRFFYRDFETHLLPVLR